MSTQQSGGHPAFIAKLRPLQWRQSVLQKGGSRSVSHRGCLKSFSLDNTSFIPSLFPPEIFHFRTRIHHHISCVHVGLVLDQQTANRIMTLPGCVVQGTALELKDGGVRERESGWRRRERHRCKEQK